MLLSVLHAHRDLTTVLIDQIFHRIFDQSSNFNTEETKDDANLRTKKNIIVLLDGTSNGYITRTNILRLAAKLSSELPDKCHPSVETKIAYFEGMGNICSWGISNYFFSIFFASDLNIKVEEACKYVCDEYDPAKKNKVGIFGFSRGAYAARILSQMIDKVGVLQYNAEMSSFWSQVTQALTMLGLPKWLTALVNILPYMLAMLVNIVSPILVMIENILSSIFSTLEKILVNLKISLEDAKHMIGLLHLHKIFGESYAVWKYTILKLSQYGEEICQSFYLS